MTELFRERNGRRLSVALGFVLSLVRCHPWASSAHR
jgi:hypothetical protein